MMEHSSPEKISPNPSTTRSHGTGSKIPLFIVGLLVGLFLIVAGYVLNLAQGKKGATAPSLLPKGTLFYAAIPNGAATQARYETSHLKNIVASPEVQGLIRKLVDAFSKEMGTHRGGPTEADLEDIRTALVHIVESLDGESFIAIPHVKIDKSAPEKSFSVIVGARPSQNGQAFGQAIDVFRRIADRNQTPADARQKGEHNGVAYESLRLPNGIVLASYAQVNDWHVVAYPETALKDFIDQAQGKTSNPSLAQNPEFQKILQSTGPAPDAFLYFNYEKVGDLLAENADEIGKALAKNSDASSAVLGMTPETVAQSYREMANLYRAIPSVAVASSFSGPNIVDVWATTRNPIHEDTLNIRALYDSAKPNAYNTLAFTHSDTLIYSSTHMGLNPLYDYIRSLYSTMAPKLIEKLDEFEKGLPIKTQLDFRENVLDALGDEMAYILDWAPKAAAPDFALIISVKDHDKFNPTATFLHNLITSLKNEQVSIKTKTLESDRGTLYTFTMSTVPFVTPTLLLGRDYVAIGMNADITSRVASGQKEATNLSTREDFRQFLAPRLAGSNSLFYCETPRLLDTTYGAFMRFVPMLGLINPKGKKTLDALELPDTLSFSQHIGTLNMISHITPDRTTSIAQSGLGSQILPAAVGLGGLLAYVGHLENANKKLAPAPPKLEPTEPSSREPEKTESESSHQADEPSAPAANENSTNEEESPSNEEAETSAPSDEAADTATDESSDEDAESTVPTVEEETPSTSEDDPTPSE